MGLANLKGHFLQQDLHKALDEYICSMNCMYLQRDAFENSDYKTARVMAESAARSLRELERLQQKKQSQDELDYYTRIWLGMKI